MVWCPMTWPLLNTVSLTNVPDRRSVRSLWTKPVVGGAMVGMAMPDVDASSRLSAYVAEPE